MLKASSDFVPAPVRQRSPGFSPRLTTWLVHWLPAQFNRWLRSLNSRQILFVVGFLLWFMLPLFMLRLPLWQQFWLGMVLIGIGAGILHLEENRTTPVVSENLHLLLITLSSLTTLRYLYYRTAYTLNWDGVVNILFSLLLYVAELYAIITLFLAYFQTVRLKERKPIDLATLPAEQLYKVDVYIPTYNEDVEIVRKTAVAAMAIDYPDDKKQVYILDDGRAEKYKTRREALRQMCDELGCILLTRDNNDHAKAGNINTALPKTGGDLVLILDCDHIPAKCILQHTVGFFANPKVALVQTPHWFYNPDPFERNLLTNGQVPVGNELFYKVLQKGNDTWNATFFCGSAAVIRRNAVLEIGGIATETVTEDCHTSLRLHSLGFETVYYDKIMVAGLAPEKFSSYIGQQVRWARGMAQILRLENPLLNRKLKLTIPQRICYFSATSHFFFGFPRLMYLVAPMLYLLLGISSVKGLGLETLLYALPHIVLSMQTNHIPYKNVRFSFWNEIYEFSMSFQAGIVTMMALVNPKLGTFNVTDKGLTVTRRSFDLESIRLLLILGVLVGASLLAVPFWLVVSPDDSQAVLINAFWSLFNLLLVIASCLVAFEQPQLRQSHRLPRTLKVIVHSHDQSWTGRTENISETGARILLDVWPNIHDEVTIELFGDAGDRAIVDAKVVRATPTNQLQMRLNVEFVHLTRAQKDALVVVLYADVQEWYSQTRTNTDNPIASLKFIATSINRVYREFRPEVGVKVRKQVEATAQLFWDGWLQHSYQVRIVEVSLQEIRLEIEHCLGMDWEALYATKPLVSLLVYHPTNPTAQPQSLLAQVRTVDVLSNVQLAELSDVNPAQMIGHVAIELVFPKSLNSQQGEKIRQLLRSLNV